MKAVVCPRYGAADVLEVRDVSKPVPNAREVLINIHTSAVTTSDINMRNGGQVLPAFMRAAMRLAVGLSGPRKGIIGLVLAGEIEEVGRSVSRFAVGDRVYGYTKLNFGAYAEYTCLKESATLAKAPVSLNDAEAAAILYGGMIALHCLRKGGLTGDMKVLIYGASGAVGTAAVQLAAHAGAEVTGVCGPNNLGLVESLGAALALDYTTRDSLEADQRYDLVVDAVGDQKTSTLKQASREALTPSGTYVSVDDSTPLMPLSDLEELTRLADAGAITAVIDRTYALEDIVEAHRYVEQGHKRGNVLVDIGGAEGT